MTQFPVTGPTKVEMDLFSAGLVEKVSLATVYDIKANTSIQRSWQDPEVCTAIPDVQDPRQWNDKLRACMRGEFFACVLEDCTRVLDIGCGEGWPSLYLARSIPEVVGMDISPGHVALARNTAALMGLESVRFEVADIRSLPFDRESFDGVCFGGNVFTYGFDAAAMLREVSRVLRAAGVFAFEQWPISADRPAWQRVLFFIDGGPPILHYGAGIGLHSRSYFIYLKPDTRQGRRLAELAGRMEGELSDEQETACEEILAEIESGDMTFVEKAVYSGQDRSLAADEFPALLQAAGFAGFRSWALPNAQAFARSLKEVGILEHLRAEDLRPCLRALVRSAPTTSQWTHTWASCRKGN
jgi:SAM-dependent methyltransferase